MARIVTPRAACISAPGSDSPTRAPTIEVTDPASANGMARRRLARPLASSAGAADSAPASAIMRPAPRTKSRWNGKKPPPIVTNSTPPPMPEITATMPSRKLAAKSASGQIHQAMVAVDVLMSATCISRYANPMPKLAANVSLLFPQLPFPERFAAAAKAGFRYVEYQFPYPFGSAKEIAERVKAAGVEVVLHNLPAGDAAKGDRGITCQPERVNEFREGVERAIEYAKAVGCPRVNTL